MQLKYINSLGLLGYIIIVNNEIHSRQIKWLNIVLKRYEFDDELSIINDILNDKDEKIQYNECLFAFHQECLETKEFIYRTCFQLAVIDDDNISTHRIDSQENGILKNIEDSIGNISFQQRQALKNIDRNLYAQTSKDIDFSDFDFGAILNVAEDDYEEYEYTFDRIFSECRILTTRLENKLEVTETSQIEKVLKSFLSEYKNKVILSLSDVKKESSKKESSVYNFSIALMGRTKAGKSTLHYIMGNEGKEFIGNGSQRTTRFNRVFQWNKFKIIDTPGIGAGEESGRKDEKIAMSVLAQADVICFVLVDDTIQNDILELLNKIAEYHKPMIIILNHKENITKKSHQKTFMNNPDEWRLGKGKEDLAGYINRLKRNAQKNNYDNLMNIIPVFLLAAQLGKEKKDSKMFDASNYSAFIEAVRVQIKENGLIYKSQTMLDEPSIRLHKTYGALEVEKNKLFTLQKKVENIRKRIGDNIILLKKSILTESERAIMSEFEDFYTAKSYMYVEENYKEKSVIAFNKSYNRYLDEYGVKEHINNVLTECISVYHRKISEIINEIDQELRYAKLNTDALYDNDSVSVKGNKGTFSFKNLFKTVSMILDAFSIIWPILGFISLPVSVVGNFFKSKQEKTDNAKILTLNNFKKMCDYSKNQVIKKNKMAIENLFKEDQNEILGFFDKLEEQLAEVLSFVSRCSIEFEKGVQRIDICLAKRILQYITMSSLEFTVIETKRDINNNTFTIIVKRPQIRISFDVERYQNISSEKIIIRYVD